MVYFKVNESTAKAKVFVEFIKTIPYVELVEKEKIPNAETKKAIQESRSGKGTRAKNVSELMKKLKE